MELTKKQTTEVLSNFISQENGLNIALEMMLNAMMLSERTEHLKEYPNNKGNGYRKGSVFGFGHQIDLQIPRDRLSDFQPTILALFRDQEQYIKEVSFSLYSKGLTTRDISSVMETIYGKSYSKSTISNISQSFYDQMECWRNRELDKHYLAFYIDGLHVKLKRDSAYANECFYIILGLKEDMSREIVAIVNFPTESSEAWKSIFNTLKKRGLESVGIVVSDNLSGIGNAISQNLSAPHQKCIVHLQRNLATYVRPEDKKELASDFREVLDPDNKNYTLDMVKIRFKTFTDKWRVKYKTFGKYLDKLELEPYFTYLNYDYRIRRMLYTTNWIERFNKSARRTLKIRGAFPNEDSVLALITSVAIEKGENHYEYPIHNFKFDNKLRSEKSRID